MKVICSNLKDLSMNSKILCIFFPLFAFILFFNISVAHAEIISNEFVDLTFTIDSKSYVSKSVKKPLDVAPFTESGYTQVPFSTIFQELGYTVEWNKSDRTIGIISRL